MCHGGYKRINKLVDQSALSLPKHTRPEKPIHTHKYTHLKHTQEAFPSRQCNNPVCHTQWARKHRQQRGEKNIQMTRNVLRFVFGCFFLFGDMLCLCSSPVENLTSQYWFLHLRLHLYWQIFFIIIFFSFIVQLTVMWQTGNKRREIGITCNKGLEPATLRLCGICSSRLATGAPTDFLIIFYNLCGTNLMFSWLTTSKSNDAMSLQSIMVLVFKVSSK